MPDWYEIEKYHRGSLELKSLYYNQILDGRELNGEPRDLNFKNKKPRMKVRGFLF
ncbi:hypothetical protein J2X31_001486 [Flavobacterium arsenatis]|uniref:Uncharacterized protein n=1 Tax=Flavobacterium arsenatis TaxID=1484332 RepID=A0ABU1TNF9_9FLAO|nr:hypothetical protein [Flavobacterium arsenatis]MDR6967475.1 hypothetical protein [Flavobacterium arsenatis]